MKLNLSQHLKQSQELRLTPMMIQSMEILQLQVMQLQARITQELEENPVLEIFDEDNEEDGPDKKEESPADENAELNSSEEQSFTELESLEKTFDDMDANRIKRTRSKSEDGNSKHEAMQNTASPTISLQDHLFNQLRLSKVTAREMEIMEHVVYNISDDGYLRTPVGDIELQLDEFMKPPPTEVEIKELIEFIQNTCEPEGVAARDLRECLMLQMRNRPGVPELVKIVVSEHLDDVMNNRLPQLAKKLNIDIEDVSEVKKFLHVFNPKPGLLFGGLEAKKVIPDVVIEQEEDGNFRIWIENSFVPDIVISKDYRRMVEKKEVDAETVQYVKAKVDSALWLIDAIHQRQNTILKITKEIVGIQDKFLREGLEHLQPLRMQEIADKVGVHVSTVSRAISGKYVQCPQGIFPMKNFFTGGSVNEDGVSESHKVVRNKVKELIDAEDKHKPLSDDEIVRKLKEQGVTIARRTAAKYRKIMEIPSARMRREY
jgi:RNA polymerase sigma-54 factor